MRTTLKGKAKIVSLLLALAMVSGSMVGCGAKDDAKAPATDSSKPAAGTDAAAPAADDSAPVKLKWYMWGSSPKKPGDVIKALNDKSMKEINTEVDFVYSTGGDEKVKTMMSTGGDFDMVFTCAWFANYVLAAQGGQLADITEKIKTVTPTLYEYIPEIVWEGAKVNGKIYAMPIYKDTAAAQYWTANKEYVIDQAGAEKEFKATGNELSSVTPLLQKVKAYADAGNKYPNALTAPMNFNWTGVNGLATGWDAMGLDNLKLGVSLADKGTTVKAWLEEPSMIENYKTMKMWHDTGLTNKDAITTEREFENLCVGSVQGYDGIEPELGQSKNYTVVINKKCGPYYTTSAIQGAMIGFSPNSKNIDRALKYTEYANTDKDYRNMLAYGIKDVNWEITPEGNAKALNDDWAPGPWSQASLFELYPLVPVAPDMYTNLKAVNDSAESSALLGFTPSTEKIANEVAASTTIIDKYIRTLSTGDCTDVDATAGKAMKELRAAGYDKILEELQAQVDAFIAAK